MDAHSAGQSSGGLRRAAPVLPRKGLMVTRARAGHDDVDPFVIDAGNGTAISLMSTVSVSDGVMDIEFEPSENNAIISATTASQAKEALF